MSDDTLYPGEDQGIPQFPGALTPSAPAGSGQAVGTHVLQPGDAWLEARVLRAVPCKKHTADGMGYVKKCSRCLTGAQAAARGVVQDSDELGIVATSWEEA